MKIVCDGSYLPFPSPINSGGSGFHFSCVNRELALRIRELNTSFIDCVYSFEEFL